MELEAFAADARVLVVILPQPRDLALARDAHWYRLPLEHAPRQAHAEALAFYLPASFGAQRWSVRSIAPVHDIQIVRRNMLLPDEANHPHAERRYLCYQLGPLADLPLPIPSARLRRITFIPTTFGRLLCARDVADLWHTAHHALEDDVVWGAGVAGRSLRR